MLAGAGPRRSCPPMTSLRMEFVGAACCATSMHYGLRRSVTLLDILPSSLIPAIDAQHRYLCCAPYLHSRHRLLQEPSYALCAVTQESAYAERAATAARGHVRRN